MLDDLVETIAEIVYDSEMEREGYTAWVAWEVLEGEVQEDFLKVAEDIIGIIRENTHLFED